MEFTIKKIISIDKDAENYKKNMNEMLVNKKKELDKLLEDMNKEAEDELMTASREYMKEKLDEANQKAETLKSQKEEQLIHFKDVYEEQKGSIVDKIFSELINSF